MSRVSAWAWTWPQRHPGLPDAASAAASSPVRLAALAPGTAAAAAWGATAERPALPPLQEKAARVIFSASKALSGADIS